MALKMAVVAAVLPNQAAMRQVLVQRIVRVVAAPVSILIFLGNTPTMPVAVAVVRMCPRRITSPVMDLGAAVSAAAATAAQVLLRPLQEQ